MADKVIVLKDPFTGDRLFPVCSSKSIIDENGNSFDISKYLTQETASTLYAAKTHTHEIANINGLQTELDNLKTSVSEGKSLIAAAVTDKGVQTAADATFQQMATNIGNIQTEVDPSKWRSAKCTISSDGNICTLPNNLTWKQIKGFFGMGGTGMGYGYCAYVIDPTNHNKIIKYGSSSAGHGQYDEFIISPDATAIDISSTDGTFEEATVAY